MFTVDSAHRRLEAAFNCTGSDDVHFADVKESVTVFAEKLMDCARSNVKRSKERSLDEALQLLKGVPKSQIHSFHEDELQTLVHLIIALQLQSANMSSACRKLDQMLQLLTEVNSCLVIGAVQQCLNKILHMEKLWSPEDFQTICMFLEDTSSGRDVLRPECTFLLGKVLELMPIILETETHSNSPLCYFAVKLCLQLFQLLPEEVVPLAFGDDNDDGTMRNILEFLMKIILGESSSRDSRLLAGTAVAMLINTAPEAQDGAAAVWSLLQVTHSEPWCLTVGKLQVQCRPTGLDGVARLAVARGLLTCCRKDVLIYRHDNKPCALLDGLFPVISGLCEEKLDCHYFVFQVFILWLRNMKQSLTEIWENSGSRLFGEDSSLRHNLMQVIWNDAESRMEGMTESVRSALCLFLEVYEMDCQHFGDTEKKLHPVLLHRITELPWESRAKYSPLCALLPFVGTQRVLGGYPDLPIHLLNCFSTNHLSPCASEVYKSLIQEQRQELLIGSSQNSPPTEPQLAKLWAQYWQHTILEALTSEVTLLQNNGSSYLLPWTLRTFPSAGDALLSSLDLTVPGHLRAWAYVVSAQRLVSGCSPWASVTGGLLLDTLRLALSSLDDSVRLAALNLVCCSPRTKEPPREVEYSTLRDFIPLNLTSESSPFRQHLQASIRRFLVRVRDCCMASVKGQKSRRGLTKEQEKELEQGVAFVDWLAELPYVYLSPGHSYQRKRTVLLLLSAVLETCTDSWSPDKKKGQPPANISSLISWARERGQWDFFSRSKQLVLIGCFEDATNEIRELSAELLVKFFPPSLPDDVIGVLCCRADGLVHGARVQQAQTGALMMKVILQKSGALPYAWLEPTVNGVYEQDARSATVVRFLLRVLERHLRTARRDMLLAARTTPIHGVVIALQRCLLEGPGALADTLDHRVSMAILTLMEEVTLHLLGVLYGDQDMEGKEVPPSFCDMGNAISSLIGQGAGSGVEGEEYTLLSEEHSLILTCCWVSLKEIGIFLGSLVERILSEVRKESCIWAAGELRRVSRVFKDIILKCRHWGAVEGCCVGFTKFCCALLNSSEPSLREIPELMLQQGLTVLQSAGSTSVTRRAAGLPMLILGILSAEQSGKARPLLARTIQGLLEQASTPVPVNWDQTVDLPQVCAVHTLNALVRGSSLALAILRFAPDVTMLSLTLLSSPCWTMRNAALQLYSSLCWRMLGQCPVSEETHALSASAQSGSVQSGSVRYGMSPPAFFGQYPALEPFVLGELQRAAMGQSEARLSLNPSLYPILTLLAKLQPGAPQQPSSLLEFRAPLLLLAANPVHGVRVMSSKALVAMIPPTEYTAALLRLVEELPESPERRCCHNRLHGQLLQIRAILARALTNNSPSLDALHDVVRRLEACLWLAGGAQRCPLVREAYLSVASLLRGRCSEAFLHQLAWALQAELQRTPPALEVGSASFHQTAVHFLCQDPKWACQLWRNLHMRSAVARLSLVQWAAVGRGWDGTSMRQVVEDELQGNLQVALREQDVEYKTAYLAALVAVMSPEGAGQAQARSPVPGMERCVEALLEVLENQGGGAEFLAKGLCAASVLMSQRLEPELLQRWLVLLEAHGAPGCPEVLRQACAQSLYVAGAPVIRSCQAGCPALQEHSIRLISIAVCLLQDECVQVRVATARFAALVCPSTSQQPALPTQVNQSLRSLLELLLQDFWDSPATVEALIGQLPQCDLSRVLKEAQDRQSVSLYEQDESNVYAELGALAETLTPYLRRLALRAPESPALSACLSRWAQRNTACILNDLRVCTRLPSGGPLEPAWLNVLLTLHFQDALCGLFSRASLLLQLLDISADLRPLCDPLALATDLREVHQTLSLNGVFLPSVFLECV